jgi:hypothetical protein
MEPDQPGQPASEQRPRIVAEDRETSAERSGVDLGASSDRGDMSPDPGTAGVHEAVGLFTNPKALQGAIDELLSSGFDRADISLLGSEQAVEASFGHRLTRSQLEDNPATPRSVYVSPDAIGTAEGSLISLLAYVGGAATAGVIAIGGGPLTMIFLGAGLAGGVGGIIGAGLAEALGHWRAQEIRSHLEAGGLLLWVRTWHREDEGRALGILARRSGRDVHVHSSPRPERAQAQSGPSEAVAGAELKS